jgi:hypothetical protein
MGDQVYRMKDGEEIPVEPVSTLISAGWLPGTWVKYSTQPLTFSGALATVDISDGTGVLAGFLVTGPQHKQPVLVLSDMWTTDQRQRPGGDGHADWGPADAGGAFELDSNLQVQRMGSRIATLVVPPTGYHKFYVFETEDLAERTNPGTGAALTYTSGDLLYVSNRGLLTSEKETLSHAWTGYAVGNSGTDFEGDFIYTVAVMAIG